MPRLTLPENLDAWHQEQVKRSGAPSREEYLRNLLESAYAADE